MQLVRDLRTGRPIGYIDGDVARDTSGKVVGEASDTEDESVRLAKSAATWMDGRQVLMDLAPTDVSTPSVQADFGIPSGDCIADQVSAVKYVKHIQGYWFGENVADAISLPMGNTSANASPPEINPGYTKTLFTTVGYALAARLPRGLVDNADFDLKRRATRRLVEGLRLAREYRVAQLVTTAANFAAANQIAAAAKWNGGVTPTPLTDLFKALGASVLPSNRLIISENVAQYFYQNTTAQVRDYVQAGGELPQVLFAKQKVLQGGATQYVWAPSTPANVAVVRVTDDPETDIPTTMTFRWLGADGIKDGKRVAGMLVRSFFVKQDDCYWIVAAHNDAEVIVSNQVGAVITGALQ